MSQRNPNEVTQEMWADWLLHPVTKTFRAYLALKREQVKEIWAMSGLKDSPDKEAQARGLCTALQQILELDAERLNGEMSDE